MSTTTTPNAAGDDRDVVICECFARDGLQHEPQIIPAARKIEVLDRFSALGFRRIEASSYSHPKYIPQFADCSEVLRSITRRPGTNYKMTCVNQRSAERALVDLEAGYGPEEISVLVSATESHSRRNLNRSRAEQWANVEEILRTALGKFTVIGTVSVAFGCPFEGKVDPDVVAQDVRRFVSLGVRYVSVADSTGQGDPRSVKSIMSRLKREVPEAVLIAHFHNTRGTGIANCVAALDAGVTYFDSSFGGVGGHPARIHYGEGNTGNVCTEDLVVMLEAMGVRTGLDVDAVMATARHCEEVLGRELLGMTTRTALGRPAETVPA